jgi:ppGpp synthetase/RelA/SpoT-type nucleotidyltranferase
VVSLTTSQVKKAGRTLRHWRSGQDVDQLAVNDAFDVLVAYRAVHSLPLVKANNGLRSMIRTAGCEVEVSQRLKRIPTILGKLVREPSLPLSSMQDIGGCRAILETVDEVRRVEARIRKNRPPVSYSDYITTPRSSGYRGVHVIVEYDDRRIEIQLRTRIMHQWAITVERLSWRTRMNLKTDGDHAIQRMMAVISHAMAIEEEGGVVPTEVLRSLKELRQEAQPYL